MIAIWIYSFYTPITFLGYQCIKALKAENETLKAELSKLNKVEENTEVELSAETEEPKPISFNPENTNPIEVVKIASKRPRNIMDSVLSKLNK